MYSVSLICFNLNVGVVMICVFKCSDVGELIMVLIGTILYLLAFLILIVKHRNLKSLL